MIRRCRQRTVKVFVLMWVAGVLVFLVHSFPETFASTKIVESIANSYWSGDEPRFELTVSRAANGHRVASAKFIPKTPEEYFQPRPSKVNILASEFLITNKGFCEEFAPYLLAVVPSVAAHTSVRAAIRTTYGSYRTPNNTNDDSQTNTRVLFFFGRGANAEVDKLLHEESQRYGDIVQADFQESYSNLTIKMMVILKWVATFCGEVDYMLKLDEDVFVNIPLLLSQLKPIPYSMEGSVLGQLNIEASVRRMGKWAVRTDQYPLPTYPTYASGNSYVISGNIIPRMFMVSEYVPYLSIEDVFVSGILAKIVGAKHISLEGFTFWLQPAPVPCDFVRENRTTATKVGATLMRELWDAQNTYEQKCKQNKR